MRRIFNFVKDVAVMVLFGGLTGFLIFGVGYEFFQLGGEQAAGDAAGLQTTTSLTEMADADAMEKINISEDPMPSVLGEGEMNGPLVSAATPVSLSVPSLNISQNIVEYNDEKVAKEGRIKPETMEMVVWWSGGGRPGAARVNGDKYFTTYLYGHSTNNDKHKAIFDDLDLMGIDDEIVISTDSGDFSYRVKSSFTVPKTELPDDPRATLNDEGRLLLISCYAENGVSGGSAKDNIVVVAELDTVLLSN